MKMRHAVLSLLLLLLAGISSVTAINTDSPQYQGCFSTSSVAVFDNGVPEYSKQTVEECITQCRGRQQTFAGMKGGDGCWCGDQINSQAAASVDCYNENAERCPGDNSAICGATNAMSVYRVCPIDKTGADCELECSCNNKGCSYSSGCLGSCDAGYTGDMSAGCLVGCAAGTYGPSCRFSLCIGRCTKGACGARDGRCTEGCSDGSSRGPYCTQSCPPGTWGSDCADCPAACSETCDKDTGRCNECPAECNGGCDQETGRCNGCNSGWHGDKCDQRCGENCTQCTQSPGCTQCQTGYYGTACGTQCSNRCSGDCDKSSGDCTSCDSGYYGQQCDSDCTYCPGNCYQSSGNCQWCNSGSYGLECEISCPSNCDGMCYIVSGGCVSCKKGFYGAKCESSCGEGCANERCDKIYGTCLCISGWTGDKCDQCDSRCIGCDETGCTSCITGSYGQGCMSGCRVNCKNGCAQSDGTCIGCKDNRYGRLCVNECPGECSVCQQYEQCTVCQLGRWGTTCRSHCSAGCQGETCSKADGSCTPCKGNWAGRTCDSCVAGKYGSDCASDCSDGCKNGQCSSSDGSCQCKKGWHGTRCENRCSDKCLDNECNAADGKCAACVEGHHGDYCDKNCTENCLAGCDQNSAVCSRCVDGKRGNMCDMDCSESCNLNKCNQHTGECSCVNGYYGTKCDKKCGELCDPVRCEKSDGKCYGCKDGVWSSYCNKTCPENCKDGTCDFTTSHCSAAGCLSTFYGSTCDLSCSTTCAGGDCDRSTGECSGCKSGYYGVYCNMSCSEQCADRECERTDGTCVACPGGYYGEMCGKECGGHCSGNLCKQRSVDTICSGGCEDGYHGTSCEESCTENCLDNFCDQFTGKCDRCVAGRQGGLCDGECDSRRFGVDCNDTCHCVGDVSCDSVDGGCPAGCAQGYDGLACQQVAPPNETSVVVPVVSVLAIIVLAGVIIFIVLMVRRRRNATPSYQPEAVPIADILGGAEHAYENISRDEGMTSHPSPKLSKQQKGLEEAHGTQHTFAGTMSLSSKPAPAKKPTVPVKPRLSKDYSSEPLTLQQLGPHIMAATHNNATTLEFESLSKEQMAPWDVAKQLPKEKNRFKNIMAYDHNRVKLMVPEDSEASDYINASYIPGFFNKEKEYIASQGPTRHILNDFIRMIWQQQVTTIIMLTSLKEKDVVKCEQYWPDAVDRNVVYRGIKVTLTREIHKMGRAERTLVFTKGGESHTVEQLHYTAWPDHGVPPSAAVLLDIRRTLRNMQHTHPILVHCSAGVGRTGTFIALDMLMSVADAEGTVNVPATVKSLRQSRINMVQTQKQYDFLYKALYEGLNLGVTVLPLSDIHSFMSQQHYHDDMQKQFNILQEFRPILLPQDLQAANFKANIAKNRSQDILPASKDRVMLMTLVEGGTDYINAVNVNGFNHKWQFVATQVPLADTVVDVWRMVMDYELTVIVHIQSKQEKKAGVRWLPTAGSPLRLACCSVHMIEQHGNQQRLSVRQRDDDEDEDEEEEGPRLYENFNATGRQLLSTDAPEPSSAENLYMNVNADGKAVGSRQQETTVLSVNMDSPSDVIQAIDTVQQIQPDPSKPRAIVCWNGASECGVFIGSSWIQEMAEQYEEVDVYGTVSQIRSHRPQFIENTDQYKFLYQVAKEYAARKS